jgi:hypothetical protein
VAGCMAKEDERGGLCCGTQLLRGRSCGEESSALLCLRLRLEWMRATAGVRAA